MNFLKLSLAKTRWGKELTCGDHLALQGMTFYEMLTSSYITPKTGWTRHDPRYKRR